MIGRAHERVAEAEAALIFAEAETQAAFRPLLDDAPFTTRGS